MRVLPCLVATLLLCVPLRAGPLPGADDPAFAAARAQWLAGEDMAALGALAGLAEGGNAAARLLIGQIEASRHLHPEALADLPRAERIALLRAPGGLSGTSWLRAADLPLAGALYSSGAGVVTAGEAGRAAALETLLAAGEAGAALRILNIALNVGGWKIGTGWALVAEHAAYPAMQGHGLPLLNALDAMLRDPAAGYADPPRALVTRAILTAADPPESDLTATRAAMRAGAVLQDSDWLAAAQAAAGEAPLAGPLRGLCEAICPGEVNACTFALLVASGGLPGFYTLSPLESAIPSADYQQSPRFARDLRSGMGSRAHTPAEQRAAAHAHIARFDTCTAEALHGTE